MLAWKFKKTGACTAKSGYVEWMKSFEGVYVLRVPGERKWKWVWKLNETLKIRIFMWKLLHDIIPVNLNLITRLINVEPECKRCGEDIKSM